MPGQIYALLVGINDYPPHVGRLGGCLNDVQIFHDYLLATYPHDKLHVETLVDADATRGNIIDRFRNHLSRAEKDDVALFKYSGHGARCKSAQAFNSFFPDGMDEGLVCIDSRQPGGFDLADKELAVLLGELAKNEPHISVILDCCHSGSGTRNADDFNLGKVRQTHEINQERPLESYLDGHFASLLGRGLPLEIPDSRHILMAACQRVQKAYERSDGTGMFSSALLDVLNQSGADIAYADLFLRCRAMIRQQSDHQEPQFETYARFNAYDGFLGSRSSATARHYLVSYQRNRWQVECGAIHGLPSDPEENVEFDLYPETDSSSPIGHASTVEVGPQFSNIELSDPYADTSQRFQAQITTLPVTPLAIGLEGDDDGIAKLQQFLSTSEDQSHGFSLDTHAAGTAKYLLIAEDDSYLLKLRETGKLIQGARGYTQHSANYLFSILKRIVDWERAIKLQNHRTRMNQDDVGFRFCELPGEDDSDDQVHVYDGNEITLDIAKLQDQWQVIRARLQANNRSEQPLHLLLVHFSQDYGIRTLYNERVEPTESDFIVTTNGLSSFKLGLEEHEPHQDISTFKLIVSTEKVDDFLLDQKPLQLGEIVTPGQTRFTDFGAPREKYKNEWFTKDLVIKLVRQVDRVSDSDAKVADGHITIKGHPTLKAGIGLTAAKTAARDVGEGIHRVLERRGMELLNFSPTRGDNASILELTDIQNPEVLRDQPLDIELDIELSDDEFILPVTYDGQHMLLVGDPSRDDSGRTHVRITEVPDIPDNRRSIGRALKLYFFKTYMQRAMVDRLRWVEYAEDGSARRRDAEVAAKVAAAKNILLLIHGIIGDTVGIADGLRLAVDEKGCAANEKFDLVLTYDYENLSTPISGIADNLKQQLEKVGLHADDEKRLTVLAHSMGGLVTRWFIEREGGDQVIDHLVMFGTPNVGSPLGRIEWARDLSTLLTTMAMNFCPGLTPLAGAMLFLLNRSKKLTPTLEQMNPDSDFIRSLNASADPGVPYTIVAGDIHRYQEDSDQWVQRLITKVGGGSLFDLLFADAPHDIAVATDSILGVGDRREPAAQKLEVACHHLNYFTSDAGLKSITEIDW